MSLVPDAAAGGDLGFTGPVGKRFPSLSGPLRFTMGRVSTHSVPGQLKSSQYSKASFENVSFALLKSSSPFSTLTLQLERGPGGLFIERMPRVVPGTWQRLMATLCRERVSNE